MQLMDSLIRRATGIPHRGYLRDPVIRRLFHLYYRRVPFILLGWVVCLVALAGVSFSNLFSDGISLIALAVLFCLLSLLVIQFQFMRPEKKVSFSIYELIAKDESINKQYREQIHYLYINKPGYLNLGDIYRLHDFNNAIQ